MVTHSVLMSGKSPERNFWESSTLFHIVLFSYCALGRVHAASTRACELEMRSMEQHRMHVLLAVIPKFTRIFETFAGRCVTAAKINNKNCSTHSVSFSLSLSQSIGFHVLSRSVFSSSSVARPFPLPLPLTFLTLFSFLVARLSLPPAALSSLSGFSYLSFRCPLVSCPFFS